MKPTKQIAKNNTELSILMSSTKKLPFSTSQNTEFLIRKLGQKNTADVIKNQLNFGPKYSLLFILTTV